METKFKLGDVLKDIVTGYEGVCMGITKYYTDCTHYGLLAKILDEQGKPKEWIWIDETRIVPVGERVELVKGDKPTSGEFPSAPEA